MRTRKQFHNIKIGTSSLALCFAGHKHRPTFTLGDYSIQNESALELLTEDPYASVHVPPCDPFQIAIASLVQDMIQLKVEHSDTICMDVVAAGADSSMAFALDGRVLESGRTLAEILATN